MCLYNCFVIPLKLVKYACFRYAKKLLKYALKKRERGIGNRSGHQYFHNIFIE